MILKFLNIFFFFLKKEELNEKMKIQKKIILRKKINNSIRLFVLLDKMVHYQYLMCDN